MNTPHTRTLAGIGFSLTPAAARTLDTYLSDLRKAYTLSTDCPEIIEEIEARIAEEILSKQDNNAVVDNELIEQITARLGTPNDLRAEETGERPTDDSDLRQDPQARISRRLYRTMQGAKLGGVCTGFGRYFHTDPVWIRAALFLPLLLAVGLPFAPAVGGWMAQIFLNVWIIGVVCYLILWFTLPVARTARQKLEMEGQSITAQSVAEAAANPADTDSHAKPIVAKTVSLLGTIVLFALKVVAGLVTIGFMFVAFMLIIGLFAVVITSNEFSLLPPFLENASIWVPLLGILVLLTPTLLIIYALMCAIGSRTPNKRTITTFGLVWIAEMVVLFFASAGHHDFDTSLPIRHTIETAQPEARPAVIPSAKSSAQIEELKQQLRLLKEERTAPED